MSTLTYDYSRTVPSMLGHALLGLLARSPQTGYQLSRRMSRPIGYFWTARHSQIYPELAALEADGLVSHRTVRGRGPRDTKRYRITASGRRALERWVGSPYEPAPPKDEFMLRVSSLWAVDPEAARALVEDARARHQSAIEEYERLEAAMKEDGVGPASEPGTPAFCDYATLQRGLAFERHALSWCEWMLTALA